MAIQRTFSIIKPDATKRNLTGKVNAKIEEAGLRIIAQKRIQLTAEQAGGFYAVHKAVSYTHPPSPRDGLLSRMPSSA